MKKLFLLVAVLAVATVAFAEDSKPVPPIKLQIDVGDDSYVRDVPTDLATSQLLNSELTDLLNKVIAAYLATNNSNIDTVNKIIAGDQGLVDKAKNNIVYVDRMVDRIVYKEAPPKFLGLGGYFDFDPLPTPSLSLVEVGPLVYLNIFNTFVVSGSAGLEISGTSVYPKVGLGVGYWLF